MNRWDDYGAMWVESEEEAFISHHGILGMHWGRRRWQNEDGSLTEAGREHYGYSTLREQNRHSEKTRDYDYKMQKSRDSVSKANVNRDIKNKQYELEKYKSGLSLNKQRDNNTLKKAKLAADSKKSSERAKLLEQKQKQNAELAKINQKGKIDMAKAKNEYKIAKLKAKTERENMRREYALEKLKEKNDYAFDRTQMDYDYGYDRGGPKQEPFYKSKSNTSSLVKGLAVAGVTAAALRYGGKYLSKALNSSAVNDAVRNANPNVIMQGARMAAGFLGNNNRVNISNISHGSVNDNSSGGNTNTGSNSNASLNRGSSGLTAGPAFKPTGKTSTQMANDIIDREARKARSEEWRKELEAIRRSKS